MCKIKTMSCDEKPSLEGTQNYYKVDIVLMSFRENPEVSGWLKATNATYGLGFANRTLCGTAQDLCSPSAQGWVFHLPVIRITKGCASHPHNSAPAQSFKRALPHFYTHYEIWAA